MDLYKKVVETLKKNCKLPNGETPGWVEWISNVFDMGKNLDDIISKVELGEIADVRDLLNGGEEGTMMNLESLMEIPVIAPEEMLI